MMGITKRDIADIVLIGIAAYFIRPMLSAIVSIPTYLGLTGEAGDFVKKSYAILSQAIYLVVLLVLNYVLLFKRSWVLSLILREGRDKELSIPEGLEVLASITFWIRLFGIYTFLGSFVSFLSGLTALAIRDMRDTRLLTPGFYWLQSGPHLISAAFGLFMIWKAEWIGKALGKLSRAGSRP